MLVVLFCQTPRVSHGGYLGAKRPQLQRCDYALHSSWISVQSFYRADTFHCNLPGDIWLFRKSLTGLFKERLLSDDSASIQRLTLRKSTATFATSRAPREMYSQAPSLSSARRGWADSGWNSFRILAVLFALSSTGAGNSRFQF